MQLNKMHQNLNKSWLSRGKLYEHEFGIFINNMLHGIQLAKSGDYIVGLIDGIINQELNWRRRRLFN